MNEMSQPKSIIAFLKTLASSSSHIFMPLAMLSMAYFAWLHYEVLSLLLKNAQLEFIFLSVCAWILSHFFMALGSWISAHTCRANVSYAFALNTYVKRLPARYLPGGIWHTASRVVDFNKQDIQHPQLTALFLLEYIFALGLAFLLGGIGVFFFQKGTYWGVVAILAATLSVIGMLLAPLFLYRFLLRETVELAYKNYILGIFIYIWIWLALAFAFVLYLFAFPSVVENLSILEIMSTYIFSWGIGFVAIFAPQGIGIFELVSGKLLDPPLALGSIAVLIAGFRVVILLGDISMWVLLQGVHFFFKSQT